MADYFYMRISTQEERGKQRYDRQEHALMRYAQARGLQFDEHNIYKEDKSGKSFINRTEWQKLEKILREGDCVYFKDISRFTREAEAGYAKYMDLMEKGIQLVFLDNATLSTANMQCLLEVAEDSQNAEKSYLMKTFDELRKFMVKVLIVSELDRVEQERLTLSKRIKDGIAAAKEKAGRKISGRKEGTMEKLTPDLKVDILMYIEGKSTQIDILKKYKGTPSEISRNTLKKYAKLIKEEMAKVG